MLKPDFSGYATRFNILCSDGRTIRPGAFQHNDGSKVPLVWAHQRSSVGDVIGHGILTHREDGMYVDGYFNDTDNAKIAKELVVHGDINALSIFANGLKQMGSNVVHGSIREVSLVLAGANPEAYIEKIYAEDDVSHSDDEAFDSAIMYLGTIQNADLSHEAGSPPTTGDKTPAKVEKTVADIYDSLTDEQKEVVGYIVAEAIEEEASASHSGIEDTTEGNDTMTNVFEQAKSGGNSKATLTHGQILDILQGAQECGSLKDSFLAHAVEYGIENIDLLFPDPKNLTNVPEVVSRRMEWVSNVLNGIRKSPFARVKTLHADLTQDDARAKGYVTGNLKKEEWFSLTKRVTTPTTVYKKQKLDRDDIIDITDMDVVAFMKNEMRIMLNEEIARAVLVGDGRDFNDEDKINTDNIRPIAFDNDFFVNHVLVNTNVTAKGMIDEILRRRPDYRGSGRPAFYTTEEVLTDMLLLTDAIGRRLYSSESELASAIRVSEIITVPVMEDVRNEADGALLGVIVFLPDYTIGADKGGEITLFDDFDIDFNQYKYLMEARHSGALTKFHSAQAFWRQPGIGVTPTVPDFNEQTGVVTIPAVTGVVYRNRISGDTLTAGAQTSLTPGGRLEVQAGAEPGYYFPANTQVEWTFLRP